MGVDISTNYASDQYTEVPFSFPPEYNLENPPKKLVSVFDKLSPGHPSNRHDQHPTPRNRIGMISVLHLEIDNVKSLSWECIMNLLEPTLISHIEMGEREE